MRAKASKKREEATLRYSYRGRVRQRKDLTHAKEKGAVDGKDCCNHTAKILRTEGLVRNF